jgi:hypothetical protein
MILAHAVAVIYIKIIIISKMIRLTFIILPFVLILVLPKA